MFNPQPQIIITGSVAFDRIMVFPGKFETVIQPDKLHVLSIGVLLKELRDTRGGTAANIAYNLALLGEKPVLISSVGQDAKRYIQALTKLGVKTDRVHFSILPTGSFSVITDQNNCQIAGFYPGAMSDSQTLTLTSDCQQNVLVVLSPHDPKQMAVQVQECQQYQLPLFYDIGQQVLAVSKKDLQAGIKTAQLLILNDYELAMLIKRSTWSQTQILSKVKLLVVTLGADGCLIYDARQVKGAKQSIDQYNGVKQSAAKQNHQWNSQPDCQKFIPLKIPAVKVKQVVDPTGAGDAFRAGFLYGFVRNWSPSLAAQLGCVLSSFAIKQYGTQEHTFTKQQIINQYRKTYGKAINAFL